jgi:sporulation protein YlmC with PRC-barrel domain
VRTAPLIDVLARTLHRCGAGHTCFRGSGTAAKEVRMLQKAIKDLRGDAIVARDGPIGSVDDVYFDDERWTVRYLVVDMGAWLPGRKVLISPACVMPIQESKAALRVALTREQIEQSPGVDRDPPISRSLEAVHARYFGYPYYWSGPYLWGTAGMPLATEWTEPAAMRAARAHEFEDPGRAPDAEQHAAESHVRSVREVVGYNLHATDGDLGRVEDFIVDDETWAIADLLVETRSRLPGKRFLVAPGAVDDVDWANREVRIRLIRDEVERTPAYR